MERGFKAFKFGWAPRDRTGDVSYCESMVRTARDAVGDCEIMVDPVGSMPFWPHGYKWALRTSHMLAEYDVVWFEEPLPADDLEGYKLLRAHSPVRSSAGEVLTRRQSFIPWIDGGALDLSLIHISEPTRPY